MAARPGHGIINLQKKEAKALARRGFISLHVMRELMDQ
jgi:hypothetical protein